MVCSISDKDRDIELPLFFASCELFSSSVVFFVVGLFLNFSH